MRTQRILYCSAMIFALSVALTPAIADEKVHVLVANDDGIEAPGLVPMVALLAADPSYRVTVVAPAQQQSVTGHGLITRHDVEVKAHTPIHGCVAWSVDGTPATVARIALTALLADDRPDIVVSGINRGENDGLGAWTSGTVAVAREAAYFGIPGVAVSLQINWDDPDPDFAAAALWAKPVIDAVFEEGLPPDVYLNLNVPVDTSAIRGYRIARMGVDRSEAAGYTMVREDEDGTRWYDSLWSPPRVTEPGVDSHALNAGWVTIVPLGLDQTAEVAIPTLLQLDFPLPHQNSVTDSEIGP